MEDGPQLDSSCLCTEAPYPGVLSSGLAPGDSTCPPHKPLGEEPPTGYLEGVQEERQQGPSKEVMVA